MLHRISYLLLFCEFVSWTFALHWHTRWSTCNRHRSQLCIVLMIVFRVWLLLLLRLCFNYDLWHTTHEISMRFDTITVYSQTLVVFYLRYVFAFWDVNKDVEHISFFLPRIKQIKVYCVSRVWKADMKATFSCSTVIESKQSE